MTVDPPKVHLGARNASTAVFIDGARFLAADDEDQQQTLLRLYDVSRDGPPVEAFHLSNAVLEPDPAQPEIDIEASAWHNGRIYWIGSHSRSRKGKPRPSRHRLFATAMQAGSPVITGSPYKTLISDVEAVLGKKLDRNLPPDEGGVSIEGLSAAPNGGLMIAFRSPLVKNKALVIELKNPADVVDSGAPAEFGPAMCLDLEGRGIRSLEYWWQRSSYLLISGPEGGEGEDFTLMRWSGPLSRKPEPLDGVRFGELGLGDGCAPEGLIIDAANTVHILFDEGDRTGDEVSFRSVAVRDLLP